MTPRKRQKSRSRGQIIARGDGKSLLRVYLGQDEAGKRKYSSKTVHGTRRLAEKELIAMLRDMDTQTYVEPSKQTVREYLEGWIKTKQNLSHKTHREYTAMLERYIYPEVGSQKLHEVTPQRLQMIYQKMTQELGLSPRTVQYTHAVVRQAFKQAVRWNLLVRSPAEHLSIPRQHRKESQILTPKQVGLLLEATHGDDLHPLWMLLLTSGLRPQEALALQWGDLEGAWLTIQRALVEKDGGKFEVGPTKTSSSRRVIALLDTTVESLRAHQKDTGSIHGFIFRNRVGRHLDPSNIRRRWHTALKKAKLPKIRLYDARHTHISHLLAGGVNLKFASERAGHSSIKLTADTYAHVLPKSQKKVAGVVEEMYFSDKKEGTNDD